MKAVIFDLDGTLVDSLKMWLNLDRDFLAEHGLVPEEGYTHKINSLSFKKAVEFILLKYKLNMSVDEAVEIFDSRALYEYNNNITFKKGAIEYIKKLKKQGIKLAIATSCTKNCCMAILAKYSLKEYFDLIIFTEDVSSSKSEPDIFIKAASLLGVLPHECVVYEDTHHAAIAAKGIGMQVIGIRDCHKDSLLNELLTPVCNKVIDDFINE